MHVSLTMKHITEQEFDGEPQKSSICFLPANLRPDAYSWTVVLQRILKVMEQHSPKHFSCFNFNKTRAVHRLL